MKAYGRLLKKCVHKELNLYLTNARKKKLAKKYYTKRKRAKKKWMEAVKLNFEGLDIKDLRERAKDR